VPFPGRKVHEVVNVMSLILLADFLMHRVVLQSRESPAARRGPAPMFHVKHFCVNRAPGIFPRRRIADPGAADVSRETSAAAGCGRRFL
jgi:hypothetical protein